MYDWFYHIEVKLLTGMAISVKMNKGPKHIDMAALVIRGVLWKPHAVGMAASFSWSWFSSVG